MFEEERVRSGPGPFHGTHVEWREPARVGDRRPTSTAADDSSLRDHCAGPAARRRSPTRASAAAQVRGVVQGVGFRPFVYRLATEAEVAGFVGNDTEGVFAEVEGAPAALDDLLRRVRDRGTTPGRVDAVECDLVARDPGPAFASCPAGTGTAASRSSRPTPRCATTACASSSIRATGATATRSSTARTAAPGSPSPPRSRTTAATRPWRGSPCAARAGVSTRTPATAGTTRSRWRALRADRSSGSSTRHGEVCGTDAALAAAQRALAHGLHRGREGRRRLSPRVRRRRRGRGGASAAAQAPSREGFRGDGTRPRRRPSTGASRRRRRRAAHVDRATGGARAPAIRAAGRRLGGARQPAARRDAPFDTAAPPALRADPGCGRGTAAGVGDDERQRQRRTDLPRRHGRARTAPRRHHRRVAAPRPADPRAVRRLGRARRGARSSRCGDPAATAPHR